MSFRLNMFIGCLVLWTSLPIRAAWNVPASGEFATLEEEYFYYCTKDSKFDPRKDTSNASFQIVMGIVNLKYVPELYCWSQLEINNLSEHPIQVYLEHYQPSTDHIELFHMVGDQTIQHALQGLMHDFRLRQVFYRTPVFKLALQPGRNQIWLKQQTRDLMVIGWKVFSPDAFVVFTSYENLLFGGFFAICFSLSLYNLIIFLVNRESLHLYYFLYLFSYGITQMFVAGLIPLYLLPDSNSYRQGWGLSSVVIAMIFAIKFVYSFLDSDRNSPLTRHLYHIFIGTTSVSLTLNILGYYTWAAQSTLILSGSVSILGILFTIIAIRHHHPMASFFAIAWGFLLVGNIIQVMVVAGVLPNTPLYISANFFGATVEAIMISFALAHRLKQQRMQETAKKRHAFSQLEKMVLPHQLIMMQDGASLEHTMPLKQDIATVICLDFIASTRSKIPDMKGFLRRFMDRCQDFMNLDYNGQAMTASGYRIKELGDGFLCSIGFPFATPQDRKQEQISLDLTLNFLASFEEEYVKEGIGQAEYCSIGIAQGQVEGFFTLSGMRSYEMFGDGIVKATRYEALRKSIQLNQNTHLITVQSGVWQKLSTEHQGLFQRQELAANYKIRNDELAQEFYIGYLKFGDAKRLLAASRTQSKELLRAV